MAFAEHLVRPSGGVEPLYMPPMHYTQNNMGIAVYDAVMGLIRELKSEERTPVEIEASFDALLKEYKRAKGPLGGAGVTAPPIGQIYVRAYNAEYYK